MQIEEAQAQLDSFVIVDVREPDEWAAGHIEGAVHIPLADVPERFPEVEDRGRLLMVCLAGGRSAKAQQFLAQQGLDVENLEGGMRAWQAAGLPIVKDDGTDGTVAEH